MAPETNNNRRAKDLLSGIDERPFIGELEDLVENLIGSDQAADYFAQTVDTVTDWLRPHVPTVVTPCGADAQGALIGARLFNLVEDFLTEAFRSALTQHLQDHYHGGIEKTSKRDPRWVWRTVAQRDGLPSYRLYSLDGEDTRFGTVEPQPKGPNFGDGTWVACIYETFEKLEDSDPASTTVHATREQARARIEDELIGK